MDLQNPYGYGFAKAIEKDLWISFYSLQPFWFHTSTLTQMFIHYLSLNTQQSAEYV